MIECFAVDMILTTGHDYMNLMLTEPWIEDFEIDIRYITDYNIHNRIKTIEYNRKMISVYALCNVWWNCCIQTPYINFTTVILLSHRIAITVSYKTNQLFSWYFNTCTTRLMTFRVRKVAMIPRCEFYSCKSVDLTMTMVHAWFWSAIYFNDL